jgi:hypothetical protein
MVVVEVTVRGGDGPKAAQRKNNRLIYSTSLGYHNPLVGGSNPSAATKFFQKYQSVIRWLSPKAGVEG